MTFDAENYKALEELLGELSEEEIKQGALRNASPIDIIATLISPNGDSTAIHKSTRNLLDNKTLLVVRGYIRNDFSNTIQPSTQYHYLTLLLSSDVKRGKLLEGRLYADNFENLGEILEIMKLHFLDTIKSAEVVGDKPEQMTFYGKFVPDSGGSPIFEIQGIGYRGLVRFLKEKELRKDGNYL